MPGISLHADAFILLKHPPGDSFQNYTVFAPEHGTFLALQRLAKNTSRSQSAPLDLFDEASLILESSNQGQTWFIKEARLITRHDGIGQSYEALLHASAFASMIARNAVPEEHRESVGTFLRQVFGAFATATRPDIAHFKALYCFARDEGHPIKQHWIPTLPGEDRRQVVELLNQPLTSQTASTPTVKRLHLRLGEYLRGHTEILLD